MALRNAAVQVGVLLIAAVIFGGGGSGPGLANLAVQLAALLILALRPQALIDFFMRAPRAPAILVGLSLALPLLQSIPLPPAIWHALPGRDPAQETLAFMGRPDAWMPLSLEVRRTLIAFVALLPPLTVLVLAWNLPEADERRLLLLLVGFGVCMVLLGTQQLITGNRVLMFFDQARASRYLQATFASHNAIGLYLVLALCALAGTIPRRPDVKWLVGGTVVAILLAVGLVLSGSRSAMALSLIPTGLAALRFSGIGHRPGRIFTRKVVAVLVGIAFVLVVGFLLASQNNQLQKSLLRFDNLTDSRPLIWQDTTNALTRFWPVGSGIGAFDEVFQLGETLENLTPGRAVRAHNDFLEVGVESGIAGLALLGLWLVFLAVRAVQAVRAGGIPLVAAAGLATIALQSISDFPLRNQTVLCVAGLLLALLINAPRRRHVAEPSEGRRT